MNGQTNDGLLTAHDPSPVTKINPEGTSPFFLLGDHAGNRIPSRLGALGLGATDLQRHIAWDIGVGALGESLAAALDCIFVRQTYSRLIVDCNRGAGADDLMAACSDGTLIPGNQTLAAAQREARIAAIYDPYHRAIAAELSRRDALGIATILVSLHSFTPAMDGFDRPWPVGVLYDGGKTAYATAVLCELQARVPIVGDNEPYRMDGTDYTIPRHAYAARRSYVELEVRQDLLGDSAQVAEWATIIAASLTAAAAEAGPRRTE